MAGRRASRDPRIEALRLVAALGIASFHTFMPWFDALTSQDATVAALAARPAAAAALGVVDLLGAYGNNVFFMISGLFLVPAAAKASDGAGYWGAQARKTARRSGSILAAVAFYAAIALFVSTCIVPNEDVAVGKVDWLTSGLEFIWVYLALTVLAPAIGWAWRRIRRRGAAVCALLAAVFVLNAYIAFFSQVPDDAGFLDWRKLMSAVTYFAAFVTGAYLSERRLSRRNARAMLGAVAAVAVTAELACALAGELELMWDLSYKSTSLISFALAAASVAFARSETELDGARSPMACTPGAGTQATGARPQDTLARLAVAAAPGILGFYIAQSNFSSVWWPVFTDLTGRALEAWGVGPFFAAGFMLSLALLASLLAFDRLVRAPLFRKLGLA